MDYKQTVELEENIKIKNKAKESYEKFLKNTNLDVNSYAEGRFRLWGDNYNNIYLKPIDENRFEFQCRFLHESYNLIVEPSYIFDAIKNKKRVWKHFESFCEHGV